VQFYADNANATNNKYKKTGGNPLVESDGVNATPNAGLPLAYVLLNSELVISTYAPVKKTPDGQNYLEGTLTNIDDIFIMSDNGSQESIYTWFVPEKSNTTEYGTDGKKKTTIALNNATQQGNRAVAKATTDVAYSAGSPTGEYWYVPGNAYMFFSTNFTNAIGGYSYGSDMLTLEMTVDGTY
jgi:hypothetical protein